MRAREAALEADIEAEKDRTQDIEEQRKYMQTKVCGRRSRGRKLGLVYPNETIYKGRQVEQLCIRKICAAVLFFNGSLVCNVTRVNCETICRHHRECSLRRIVMGKSGEKSGKRVCFLTKILSPVFYNYSHDFGKGRVRRMDYPGRETCGRVCQKLRGAGGTFIIGCPVGRKALAGRI